MTENSKQILQMKFAPNTIEHLGVKMYSTLPPVVSELIANSYDADASEVAILLKDSTEKEIVVSDNGHGMSFNEINEGFLTIGRNRRVKNETDESPKGRKVIGKKGLGKLSLTSDGMNMAMEIEDFGETSIQLIPIDYADETPSNDSIPQGTIFTTIPKKGESAPVIEKLAAVHAPEKGEESHAVVSKENIKTPNAFSQAENPECKEWIANMGDLIDAVTKAKGKKSDIDPDMAHNDRERALLMELKEKMRQLIDPLGLLMSGEAVLNY